MIVVFVTRPQSVDPPQAGPSSEHDLSSQPKPAGYCNWSDLCATIGRGLGQVPAIIASLIGVLAVFLFAIGVLLNRIADNLDDRLGLFQWLFQLT